MSIFTNAWNKIKGIITGGSDSETENKSRKLSIGDEKSQSEINFLHNHNAMMNNKVVNRRMRRKMRRETLQKQRG